MSKSCCTFDCIDRFCICCVSNQCFSRHNRLCDQSSTIEYFCSLLKVMHPTCAGDLANFLHSSTAASSLSFLRPVRMTVAPLCTNCLAVAAPIPEVEPVNIHRNERRTMKYTCTERPKTNEITH